MAMRQILLVIALCLAILPFPVLAQEAQPSTGDAPALSSLEIALWPEYDRPEVLVIYRGVFAPDTPLPVPVEIRIPASAGQPSAVAYVNDAGDRLNQAHTTRAEGDEIVVSFELPTLAFQLEFYDSLPVDAAGQREYAYTYTADYPVAAVDLEFQEPPTAQGFSLDPPADSAGPRMDGLTYHVVEPGAMEQGEAQRWAFTYQKPDSELTIAGFVEPETPAPVPVPEPTSNRSTVLIFLVAFLALVGVGAGAFWLGRQTQTPDEASAPPRRQKRRGSGRGPGQQQQASPSLDEGALFCYQCGTSIRSDSEFCHKCGSQVHRT